MRRSLLMTTALWLTSVSLSAASSLTQNPQYLEYIAQWRDLAEQHQVEYGIPASITLAQGLLESNAGQSELATEANNHFGIKCTSDWMGPTYSYDDDRKNDCFRVYSDAAQSYKDHALFLKRDRYKTCFDIPVSDYAAWARRLKECGYATDPKYPQKLIHIIELYNLAGATAAVDTVAAVAQAETTDPSVDSEEVEYTEPDEILSAAEERERFFLNHAPQKSNGLKYVVANASDTYANVAFRLNIRERDLREWNDALGRTMHSGDYIYYTGYKANQTKDARKTYYWVHPGETVWGIAQREGIKVSAVRAFNGWDDSINVLKTRQKIQLRKD